MYALGMWFSASVWEGISFLTKGGPAQPAHREARGDGGVSHVHSKRAESSLGVDVIGQGRPAASLYTAHRSSGPISGQEAWGLHPPKRGEMPLTDLYVCSV